MRFFTVLWMKMENLGAETKNKSRSEQGFNLVANPSINYWLFDVKLLDDSFLDLVTVTDSPYRSPTTPIIVIMGKTCTRLMIYFLMHSAK